MRVYYDHPTPLVLLPSGDYAEAKSVNALPPRLEPPAPEKEFLISPPGSPPVGWEPREEDRPNTDTLAADLMEALHKLAVETEAAPRAGSSSPPHSVTLLPEESCVPGVVLHTTGDDAVLPSGGSGDQPSLSPRPPMQKTRRPTP